jgi:hypothetical protein
MKSWRRFLALQMKDGKHLKVFLMSPIKCCRNAMKLKKTNHSCKVLKREYNFFIYWMNVSPYGGAFVKCKGWRMSFTN